MMPASTIRARPTLIMMFSQGLRRRLLVLGRSRSSSANRFLISWSINFFVLCHNDNSIVFILKRNNYYLTEAGDE